MISPSAAVVSADLAAAALECTALARARKLAQWVGPGRELTASGVLRPAAAAEACQVLGIPLASTRLRSALDVNELMQDWTVAADAGFVIGDGRRVYAAPDLTAPPDPRLVLDAWVTTASAVLGVPDDPCGGCLAVLHELHAADRPLAMQELASAVGTAAEPEAAGEPCPDCGGVHDPADLFGIGDPFGDEYLDEQDGWEHAEGTVAGLAAFGAADDSGGAVRLTPLGAMLATAVFEGCAPAPDADVSTLLSTISELPNPVAMTMAALWFGARSADAAVRELLTFAESASGDQRIAAVAFATALGPAPTAAWREWAGRSGFGAYARQWLAEQGERVAQHPADEAWLIVDAFSAMLDALSGVLPPELLAAAFQQQVGGDAAEALALLRGSGHPAATGIAALLTGPDPAPGRLAPEKTRAQRGKRGERGKRGSAGAGSVYQLKISLREVSKPPVWRRVVVPADITLEELSEVILRSMGWDGGHLHVFSTSRGEYGRPDPDLGHADEAGIRLAELLSAPGDKMRYSYDFGDGWEHDVLLEGSAPAVLGSTRLSCVTGKGACPPEDCGGPWGYADLKEILADPGHEEHQDMLDWLGLDSGTEFDPGEFSPDMVNARLAYLGFA